MGINKSSAGPLKQKSRRSTEIILRDLPKHAVSEHEHPYPKLIVRGLVRKRRSISLRKLRSFLMVKLSEDFKCLEGWVAKDVLWEGVPVSYIMQFAGLKRSAKFLLFSSGRYTYALSLEKCSRITTMLALKKSGRWLTISKGGPVRLVFKGHNCYESVKRVYRIDVLEKKPCDTARTIALPRIGASV